MVFVFKVYWLFDEFLQFVVFAFFVYFFCFFGVLAPGGFNRSIRSIGSAEEAHFLDKFLKPGLGSPHGQPSSVCVENEPVGSFDDSGVTDAMACWSGVTILFS